MIHTIHITEELIQHYSYVSDDDNPIHLDEQSARDQGLPKKIAHGVLTVALTTKLITPYLIAGYFIKTMKVKMLEHVFVNDTIEASIKPINTSNDTITFQLVCLNSSNQKVLNSKIKLKRLKNEN